MFSYAVYTFSFNRLTPVRYLSECSRDSCGGINISVIDTVRPRLLCVLGKLCKLVPYIGLANGRGEERRGEKRRGSDQYAWLRANTFVVRVCVSVVRMCARVCVMWVRCLSRGQNDQLSPQSRFIRVPSPLAHPAWPHPSPSFLLSLPPPKLYASIASMRVSIDALRARRE